jgi:hypothetical protein
VFEEVRSSVSMLESAVCALDPALFDGRDAAALLE